MIKVTGKPDHVSREQVRSFLHASFAVLAYHGLVPAGPIDVRIKRRMLAMGSYGAGQLSLRASLNPEDMLTTVVHEMIHACTDGRFPEDSDEKCTSTLCSKIKADVLAIADVLLDGTYRRAAYVAHTKMRYVAKDGDHYDPAEDDPAGVRTRYHDRARRRPRT